MTIQLDERQRDVLSRSCLWVETNTIKCGGLSFCALDALARENTVEQVRLVDTYPRRPYYHPNVLFVQYVTDNFESDSRDSWWGILVVMDTSAVDWSHGTVHSVSKRSPRS